MIFLDDGDGDTTILLQCENADGKSGVAGAPTPQELYPLMRALLDRTREMVTLGDTVPFELEVDVSEMPAGIQPFDSERFIARVGDAVEAGYERVSLSLGNAAEWGYQGQAEPTTG